MRQDGKSMIKEWEKTKEREERDESVTVIEYKKAKA